MSNVVVKYKSMDFLVQLPLLQLNYREEPETFAKELEEFSRLRSYACIRPIIDFSGLTQLRRYYAQLHLLQNRFKIKKSGPLVIKIVAGMAPANKISTMNEICRLPMIAGLCLRLL